MKFCKVADIVDWQDAEFQSTATMLGCGGKDRKAWEFIHVYIGLKALGLLNQDTRALGLGVGHECLIYAFTNSCKEVIATDLYESQDWSTASMAVNDVYERNPFPYQRDRLLVKHMDMTQIEFPDNSFDFIWSCCAIEHVNNFRDLHRVYQEIHRVLKPGGIAALTTEFNSTDRPSYEPNLLFTDASWIEAWLTGNNPLVQGFDLLDFPDLSITPRPENAPVPRRQPGNTIQIYCNDIVLNSVAVFLRKAGDFSRPYDENWLSPFWSGYLTACDRYREGNFAQSEALLTELLQANALEPRLNVRASRRLADALFAQGKIDEVRTVCKDVLPDCEVFEDEDQFMPLAVYCQKVGLEDEANYLYGKIENLASSNIDLVIQSLLAQAKYFERKGEYAKSLELIKKADQAIVPGSHTVKSYRHKIYFRTGFLHEKMGQLELAVRFYRQAIKASTPGTDFHTNCYLRLTHCLQNQVNQLKETVHQLEATNHWMQTSKFWQLRSKWISLKEFLKSRSKPASTS
jgi:SAM-dependent methyltransferase/tetratricopeptide (TPR) repeat protein